MDKPSSTAVLVSIGVATVYRSPRWSAVLPAGAGELTVAMLKRESAVLRWLMNSLRSPWVRAAVKGIERLVVPGIFLHFGVRKRVIDDEVRAALDIGFGQVVVLGAGLDTLAVRLHREYSKDRFLEVDHPLSQSAKRRLLPPEVSLGENLCFCAKDLAQPDVLQLLCEDEGFAAGVPTVFVAEGLLMYLAEADVERLFAALVKLAPGCRIVFTAMVLGADGKPAFQRSSSAIGWWLRKIGEPFRWGIAPEDMLAFAQRFGLTVQRVVRTPEAARLYLAGDNRDPIAAGELVYVVQA